MNNKDSDRTIKRTIAICCLLFAVSAGIRLLFLLEYRSSPTFSVPIVDSASYDRMADILVEEGRFDTEFFWHGFLYPFFLSGIYAISGSSIAAARIAQALLAGLTTLSVFFLGNRLFNRKTALAAALITAFYGPLIFFDTALLATGLAALLAPALVLMTLKTEREENLINYILLGLCAGLAIICRATFAPYAASLLIMTGAVELKRGMKWKSVLLREALLAGGVVAVLLPVAVASARVTGHFSPLPRSGSINMYIGNNPDTDRTMSKRPGAEWRSILIMPERNGKVTEREYRQYFMDRFKEYAVSQPGSFLAGLAAKSYRFFSSREIPRNYDIYSIRHYSKVISALTWKRWKFGFPFGLILPLALLGLYTGRRRVPAPMWLFLILYPASVILVFSASRLRAPLIPVLAVPAAAGAIFLIESLVSKRLRIFLPASAGLLLTAFIISAGGPFVTERHDYSAELHACVGYQLSRTGRSDEAVFELQKALAFSPGFPAAHRILGCLLQEQGRNEEALVHLDNALDTAPDPHVIHYYIGVALLNSGRRDEGLEHLEKAAEAIDWTRKTLNVTYIERLDQFGGHSAARCLTLKNRSGSDLIKALVVKLQHLGVEILKNSLLKQIIIGKENGVTGIIIQDNWRVPGDRSGNLKHIMAQKGVILATGGYGGDIGFRSFLLPKLNDAFQTTNHKGATAEGLIAALKANASAIHLSRIQLLPSGCPDEKGYGKGGRFGSYVLFPFGILVNPKTGQRIVNEWADRKERADAMVKAQTHCIGIIDSIGAEKEAETVSQCLKTRKVQVFDTISDLAKQFRIPLSSLKKSIQDYNNAIDQGKPDAFGKPVTSSTLKISSPPYYAIRLWPKIHYTPGGIGINSQAQVLDFNQKPIPGLYAAGEVTGGVHGAGRLGSCALTECIVFGRIAGKQAGSIRRPANA